MKVSREVGLIAATVNYIKNDNIQLLQKSLDVMPLNEVPDTDFLLASFLTVCAKFNRSQAVRIILKAWETVYPPDKIQVLSILFLINAINLPTLSYAVLAHRDYSYVELMDELISYDNSPEVTIACGKADSIFGLQPYETYKIVRDHADENSNYRVQEYAEQKMRETGPYAAVPKWVQTYGQIKTDKELQDMAAKGETKSVSFTIPPDEEAANLLTEGLYNVGMPMAQMDQVRSFLLSKLSTSTRDEKIKLLKPIMENQAQLVLGGDIGLFRIFGPANPLVNQDLTLDTPSSKYGGCRMFLCDIFDYNEEYDMVEDWFQGYCEECNNRIRHYWHALRRPRPHGGWTGSYCSWKCVRESVMTDGLEPDLLTHELINIYERKIETIGIQDRLDK